MVLQMLPVERQEESDELKHHWDYIYEPDAKELLDVLLDSLYRVSGLSGCC